MGGRVTMRDNDMFGMNNLSMPNAPSLQPLLYRPLARRSHKLGRVATQAFRDIGRLLHPPLLVPQTGLLEKLREVAMNASHQDRSIVELQNKVRQSHQVLAIVRTVFPLTLFPDSVVVDRTKVTIIHRTFFWSAETISFQIEDILNVSASVGPFFGSLTVASRVMSTIDHFQVHHLWRHDAIVLKHIIQGYIIAKNNKMNTDHLSPGELVALLSELGIDSDR
jgi:hypothetical protein